MKLTSRTIAGLAAASGLLAALAAAPAASQAGAFQVTRILPQGSAYSTVATGMNDQGHVVGWSQFFDGSTSLQAWIWTPAGGLTYLPDPPGQPRSRAIDINAAGVICGDGGYDSGDAWRYANGVYEFLPHVAGDSCGVAGKLNATGAVAYTSRNCGSFLQPPNAMIAAPGQPVETVFPGAWALGLNDLGQSVGYVLGNRAWRSIANGPELLPQLGSKPLSWAAAVNNAGMIVGESAAANGNGHVPWYFTDAEGIVEIGNFGGSAGAADVNAAGVVIGNAGPSVSNPWMWSASGGLVFIKPLIDPAEKLGLLGVLRINDAGQILARAIDNVTAQTYPVILTPSDGSSPWTQLGHGLAGTWGTPSLWAAGTLEADTPLSLTLDDGLQNSVGYLVLGFERLDLPFSGGTLVPAFEAPTGAFVPLPTGMIGAFTIGGVWPAGVPSGLSLYTQMWIVDPAGPFGLSATNALQGDVP